MKNIVLIGLGLHAQRIYYPLIEKYYKKYGIRLLCLIDLVNSKSTINEYLKNKSIKPLETLFLDNSRKNVLGKNLDARAKAKLETLHADNKIDGIIISTEPKAHKIYAEWALKNDIDVLMDKPITAPANSGISPKSAKQIYLDFKYLKKISGKSKSKFYIVCQRRNHTGYLKVKAILADFIKKYSIPISFIDIYHSDGTWNFPYEFDKENHPYKYGYGKLMHSGYHSVDLLAWLIELNKKIKGKEPDNVLLNALTFKPLDFFTQINKSDYMELFPNYKNNFTYELDLNKYKNYGEQDIFLQLQLLRKERVITTSTVNLQQNSFSRRSWVPLPKDTYKSNGRLRHERIHLQISHLLNLQVHSYQAYQAGKKDIELKGPGNEDHFDIYLYRNSGLVGGSPFEKISIGEKMKGKHKNDKNYLGHNEYGREMILLNFLERKDDNSELYKHDLTNKLISKTYEALALAKNHQAGSIKFGLN